MSGGATPTAAQDDAQALLRLINGFQISQAIYVVARLGIPDLLAEAPRGNDDLATGLGCDADALYRVMRALAAAGVLSEAEGRIFALTRLGDDLRSDAATSRDAWTRFALGPPHWAAWGAMLHTVRTGENAFCQANGRDVWTHRAAHPADGALFDQAMRERSVDLGRALLDCCDLDRFTRIADIGGGDGALLATILQAHPATAGVLLDRPHVVARAAAVLGQAGVLDRSQIMAGDFFAAVPEGADAYVLKHVLHDWGDADALVILRNCRRAMGAGARLLVIERLLAPANEGLEGKLSDLNMLVNAGGRERTHNEFAALLRRAGLALTAVASLAGGHNVLEARTYGRDFFEE